MGRLALLAVVTLALAACGSGERAAQPATTDGAGGFSGTTLDGETISLGDFRGRPVLVNVWSSW